MDKGAMDCINVGIEIFPFNPPPPPPKPAIPDKLLAILKKYKYNWRLKELSKPIRITHKYVSEKEAKPLRYDKPKEIKLEDHTMFYSDQLATPALKNLIHNKILYRKINKKLTKKLNKNLKKAWNSIYNFYKKRERNKRLKQRRKEKAKQKGEKKPKVFPRIDVLAKPKRAFKPPPPPQPPKIFDNFERLDVLASPKVYIIQPPKREGVSPHALTYETTEIVHRLAKIPKRFENLPKQLEPGAVKRSALKYKITPRVEALCVPKTTREKAKDDDDFDPWAISKNALKYKATARILDLAKPRK